MRLVAEKLSVARGQEPLFIDVGFSIDAGTALVVTGANGIGKSTLLRAVAGLIRPICGHITLEGGPADAEGIGESCHYLGHSNGMKRELTVRENLLFWRGFMGASGLAIEDAVDALGLPTLVDLPYGYLSAGQQRRIAMARLLVSHRPVWILDEPTAALDEGAEALFAAIVNRQLGLGGIVLAATHQKLAITPQATFALEPSSIPAAA